MPLSTNFNVSPYFDDFDENKKYYRILFKPATAVQARELTQLQTIIQNQIERFADSIYKPGTIVDGCSVNQIPIFRYVRLEDNYANNFTLDVTNFTNYEAQSVTTGLRAKVSLGFNGAISLYPNTNVLYVNYLNTGNNAGAEVKVFSNNEVLQIFDSNNSLVGNVTTYATRSGSQNTTGIGYGVTVTGGIVYQKGYFLKVDDQTVLVSSNNQTVDGLVAGFQTTESIVTYTQDSSLLDNALGYSNENAPGADRVKLVANLTVLDSVTAANTAGFLPIVTYENGQAVRVLTDPQYSRLGDEIARRNYDATGNFIVKAFNINTQANTANADYIDVIVSAGKGYVQGYPVELIKGVGLITTRGIDYLTTTASTSLSYGNYVVINELAGIFDFTAAETVDIYNTAQLALTNNRYSGLTPTGLKIGTAQVRAVLKDEGLSGTPSATYLVYLFNIKMDSGYSFTNNAKSLYFNGTPNKGVADLVLNNNQATIYTSEGTDYAFSFGKSALRRVANASNARTTTYTVRTKAVSTLQTDGTISFTVTGRGGTTGVETFVDGVGVRTDNGAERYVVIATGSNQTANLAGTVTVTGVNVTGSSTTFTNHFSPGDYIKFPTGGESRRIATVVNDTSMTLAVAANTLAAGNSYYRFIPSGYVFPLVSNMVGTRNINITSTTQATVNTGTGVAGALTGTSNVTIYYDMKRSNAVEAAHKLIKNVIVKIDTSNNVTGSTGPWSLGIPNVHKLNHIYVGTSYSNTNVDYLNKFYFDNGQRDTHYDLASLFALPGAPVDANTKIMVDLDALYPDYSTGTGFFTVDSYPVDDTSPDSTHMYTYEIPVYVDSTGKNLSLRDHVDFRPYVSNTATLTTNSTLAVVNPANTTSTFQLDSASVTGLYIPSPDTNLTSNVEFYVGRKELIYMDTNNNLNFRKGEAAENPRDITAPLDLLTIAYLDVKPYPSLTTAEQNIQIATNRQSKSVIRDTNYLNQITPVSIRRYTMSDIGTLENRISRLEYYTSLSLLEKAATDMQIPSATTGLNRFKNGIFVEPFNSHGYGDVSNPEYRIGIDAEESYARPVIDSEHINLEYSSGSNANNFNGAYVINYTTTQMFFQSGVSEEDQVSPGEDYTSTTMFLYPNQIREVDYNSTPAVQTTTSTAQALSNAANNANRMVYGAFREDGQQKKKRSETGNTSEKGRARTSSQDSLGGTKQVDVTGGATYAITGEGTNSSRTQILVPYIGQSQVAFKATGMRPNTVVYAYLDGVNWNSYTRPGLPNTSVVSIQSHERVYATDNFGGTLRTNANGVIYGKFSIPAGTVRTGNKIFALVDANTAVITESNVRDADDGVLDTVTTYAFGHFTAQRTQVHSPAVLYPSVGGMVAVGPAASAAGVGVGGAGVCFTKDTMIKLANGRSKKISEIKVGDTVVNYNNKSVNKVVFIEVFNAEGKLYSPTKEFKPFATLNHPIYVDGKLSSVIPEVLDRKYPWLGKFSKIKGAVVSKEDSDEITYNLWVDGDGTYTVNGFGTTSIIGDGGWMRRVHEADLATEDEILDFQRRFASGSDNLIVGAYIINSNKISNSVINKTLIGLFKSRNKLVQKTVDGVVSAVGFVGRIIKRW